MTRSDLRKFLEDVFGDSMIRMEQFREDQWSRIEERISELARKGVEAEMVALARRLDEVERRLHELERERAERMKEEV